MRIIGRIILGVVGVLLIVSGVTHLINSIQALNTVGWANCFANEANIASFSTFITGILECLFGLVAFMGCIRGRKSIKLGLCAILLFVPVVIALVFQLRAGPMDWGMIWSFIGSFALPIFYFLGFLLV